MAKTVKLISTHVKNGAAVIAETEIKFDADGVSEPVSQEVARAAVVCEGFSIHEGELTAATPVGDVQIVLTIKEEDGTVRGKFTKTGKVKDLFADGVCAMNVKLDPVKAAPTDPAETAAEAKAKAKAAAEAAKGV